MHQTSLYFNFKIDHDKKTILEMFFKDWADSICNREVAYSISRKTVPGSGFSRDIIRVDFENEEDAVALKLIGIPQEFQQYLEIVDCE